MRYRAVAIASERSNAVGPVELECTAHGLFVTYVQVGPFSQGYAPAALTSGTGLTIPWDAVPEARFEGDQLLLAIDPKLTPLNRLLLTHFESGRSVPAEELAKRRLLVRFASVAAALVAALLVGAWVLRSSAEGSAFAAIGFALLGACVLLGVGFVVDRGLAASGDHEATLAGFVIEIGQYLPSLVRLPRPEAPRRALPDISELQGLLPRTTFAIVVTLTAGALGVLLVARWVTTNERAVDDVTARMLEPSEPAAVTPPPRPAAKPAVSTVQSSLPQASSDSGGDGITLTGDCRCERADSALWASPLPKLSVLVLSQHVRLSKHADEKRRRKQLELDIAVVNNSNHEIEEVALMVLFFERDPPPSNRRNQVSNRPLFFEGPLLPGQAIKWSVEAEGTEFELQNPIAGDIGPNGEDAAPTNRLAELLQARNRPVRLHGAMLLAFMNDPRARDGVLGLREALREDEAPYLTRLVQALSEVKVCQLRVNRGAGSRAQASACVFNTTKEAKSDLGIKLRGLEQAVSIDNPGAEPPTVSVERRLKIPGELPANGGKGLRFGWDLEGSSPVVFEAYADRYDLLQ